MSNIALVLSGGGSDEDAVPSTPDIESTVPTDGTDMGTDTGTEPTTEEPMDMTEGTEETDMDSSEGGEEPTGSVTSEDGTETAENPENESSQGSSDDSMYIVNDDVFAKVEKIKDSKKEVTLKHGKSYSYNSDLLDVVLLNDNVELFKEITVPDTDETVKPDKGKCYLGIFLTVKNNSEKNIDYFGILLNGFWSNKKNKNKEASISYNILDDLEHYSLNDSINSGETKKICLLYEVPTDIQKFYFKTADNKTKFNIDISSNKK